MREFGTIGLFLTLDCLNLKEGKLGLHIPVVGGYLLYVNRFDAQAPAISRPRTSIGEGNVVGRTDGVVPWNERRTLTG